MKEDHEFKSNLGKVGRTCVINIIKTRDWQFGGTIQMECLPSMCEAQNYIPNTLNI
jgi:hypothetical protein